MNTFPTHALDQILCQTGNCNNSPRFELSMATALVVLHQIFGIHCSAWSILSDFRLIGARRVSTNAAYGAVFLLFMNKKLCYHEYLHLFNSSVSFGCCFFRFCFSADLDRMEHDAFAFIFIEILAFTTNSQKKTKSMVSA